MGNGASLVMQMQLGGDLGNTWIMLDHVKHVTGWTTMACHVHDLAYCKMMTITICDIQYEDIEVQQIMWTKFNETMLEHGFLKPKFKGFMTNNTQANWWGLFMVLKALLSKWLINNTHVYSIGFNRSIGTPKNWSNLSCKINTMVYANNTRMQNPLWRLTTFMLQFVVDGVIEGCFENMCPWICKLA